ncbi:MULTISPECIES: substrate-binding domain-containing protein [unclassified Streptomyces]|uniref:sugar ABC transporter substrate-binding protein n=1 Tax=unclassified Streptomyces TaxID=2593676 RepID=UPI0034259AA0
MANRVRRAVAVVAALPLLALAACGSGNAGADTSKSGGTADAATAKQMIQSYLDKPSAFPITQPLEKSPAGKKIAYMDCGTPICALFYQISAPAAKALGMTLTRINTGQAADTVGSAFDTAVSGGYDGVFVPAIPPSLWQRGLDALHAKGIPVVTTGVTGGDASKIAVRQVSERNVQHAAQLLAAYVVAEHGADVNTVLYKTPELPFTDVLSTAFQKEMKALCDGCKVRTADIPAASLGSKAPSIIVDDLQAHPDTKTVVFSVGEQANGLAAATKAAGLGGVEMIANSPTPETLQQIKDGSIKAGLGLDLAVIGWTAVDSLARLTTGQKADPGAVADNPPIQFLTKSNLPADVSKGWTGYPDFAQRFAALWKPAS